MTVHLPLWEATLRMITLEDVLQGEIIPNVIGLVKGPRRILGPWELERLAQRYPDMAIAYIGRHPQRVLAHDTSYTCDTEYTNLIHVHTRNGDLKVISVASSPLSAAVAAFVWSVAEAMFTGTLHRFEYLTITAGNSFAQRTGHSCVVNQVTNYSIFRNRRVVIPGAGDIGLRVLQLFAHAGAHVAYSAHTAKSPNLVGRSIFYPSLSDLLARPEPIDICTVHLPAQSSFSLKKVGFIRLFLQTASGLDEDELIQALRDGRIQTAVVDVFQHEGDFFAGKSDPRTGSLVQSKLNPFAHPLDSSQDRVRKRYIRSFIEEKRLLLTPHIAYYEERAVLRTLRIAVANILFLHHARQYTGQLSRF